MTNFFLILLLLIAFLIYMLLFNYKIIEGNSKKIEQVDSNLEDAEKKMDIFNTFTKDI